MSVKQLPQTGERLWITDLASAKRNHVARYGWAAQVCQWLGGPRQHVLDVGCGTGYGSKIISNVGLSVTGIDRNQDAIDIAKECWDGLLEFSCDDVMAMPDVASSACFDAVVAIEIIEHLVMPELMLEWIRRLAVPLVLTVPNEEWVPHDPIKHPFHVQHFTRDGIHALLESCGFLVQNVACETGDPRTDSRVVNEVECSTERRSWCIVALPGYKSDAGRGRDWLQELPARATQVFHRLANAVAMQR